YTQRRDLPAGVEVFLLRGPLFFGVASRLSDVIDNIAGSPKVFILRMREVPMIDASGASRLNDLLIKCRKRGTHLILSGLQPQPRGVLTQMHVLNGTGEVQVVKDFAEAIEVSRRLTAG